MELSPEITMLAAARDLWPTRPEIASTGDIFMRQIFALILFAVISILSAVCPADAGGRPPRGVITAIDYSGHTFTCRWQSEKWTYQVRDDTTYYVNDTQVASFADLRIDGTIEVEYHEDGGARIADRVVLIVQ